MELLGCLDRPRSHLNGEASGNQLLEHGPGGTACQERPVPRVGYGTARHLSNSTSHAHAYREALLQDGPHPDVCFNLANVLYGLGQKQQAAERYHQALELDQQFAQAWNNLGNVLADLGQIEEALRAFRKAIHLDPQIASARRNLDVVQDQTLRA